MLKQIAVLLMLSTALAIDQPCPCPDNSNCLSNSLCACNPGFIGNCSTRALAINAAQQTVQLTQNQVTYLQINPTQLDHYLEFTFTICPTEELSLTLTLYGQTGQNSQYNSDNQLGSSSTKTYQAGCTQITTPYISFGFQPNGQYDLLILGVIDHSQSASISINVTQQVVIGVFMYYYILIAIVAIIAVIILIAIGVFIYRRRVRRSAGSAYAVSADSQFNNIDHFQNFMPLFAASQIGADRPICPICIQQIEEAQVVRRTPCRHIFHSTCLDAWGMKNMSCPVCRMDLSLTALTTVMRMRNSTIQMELPPEDDDDEWEYQIELTKRSALKNSKEEPQKGGLPTAQKKEIRENML